jgi:hypothetical protein
MYEFRGKPGLGIIASHGYEGWERVNLYAFGLDMEELQKALEEGVEEGLMRSGMLCSKPAQSKVLVAGGVVFKGVTCLVSQEGEGPVFVSALERELDGFQVVSPEELGRPPIISPLEVYFFVFRDTVLGLSRVIFFEYSTQVALVGLFRERDRNLLNDLYSSLAELHMYMTVPSPLKTEDHDSRVGVGMFMIRHPLREELQADFVDAIRSIPGLAFLST